LSREKRNLDGEALIFGDRCISTSAHAFPVAPTYDNQWREGSLPSDIPRTAPKIGLEGMACRLRNP